eukprot:3536353-Prymnesium_polylepis.1
MLIADGGDDFAALGEDELDRMLTDLMSDKVRSGARMGMGAVVGSQGVVSEAERAGCRGRGRSGSRAGVCVRCFCSRLARGLLLRWQSPEAWAVAGKESLPDPTAGLPMDLDAHLDALSAASTF